MKRSVQMKRQTTHSIFDSPLTVHCRRIYIANAGLIFKQHEKNNFLSVEPEDRRLRNFATLRNGMPRERGEGSVCKIKSCKTMRRYDVRLRYRKATHASHAIPCVSSDINALRRCHNSGSQIANRNQAAWITQRRLAV